MDNHTEVEVLKVRINFLEEQIATLKGEIVGMKKDVHKIASQVSAMRYILIGVILAEGPQAVESIKVLFGL